jgi:hypothetical protein
MVGLLALTIGLTLLLAGARRNGEPEVILLAVMSALSFSAIDLVYSLSGRISKIYAADAFLELALVVALCWSFARCGTALRRRA